MYLRTYVPTKQAIALQYLGSWMESSHVC